MGVNGRDEDIKLLGRSWDMLPRKKFEILDLHIAGNCQSYPHHIILNHFYKYFTIPSGGPFWLLGEGGGAPPADPFSMNFHFILFLTFAKYDTQREHTTAQAIGHVVPSRPGEEVTVRTPGISLLLSTSVWVLLSPPIERRETRPTA